MYPSKMCFCTLFQLQYEFSLVHMWKICKLQLQMIFLLDRLFLVIFSAGLIEQISFPRAQASKSRFREAFKESSKKINKYQISKFTAWCALNFLSPDNVCVQRVLIELWLERLNACEAAHSVSRFSVDLDSGGWAFKDQSVQSFNYCVGPLDKTRLKSNVLMVI